MKKKKNIIGVILIVVIFCGMFFINKMKKQNYTIGKTVSGLKKVEIINCNSNYKNITFKINIDNTKANDELNMYIKNPKGEVVDKFKISSNDKSSYNKTLKGRKGDWKLEFNRKDDSNSYSYHVDFHGNNK